MFCNSRQAMMPLTQTDLPEPVVPAMSTWGMAARSAPMGCPATFWPSPTRSGDFMRPYSADSITSRSETSALALLGTSMPTYPLPGTGA